MTRLTAPNGSTVNVSDERAEILLAQGFKAVKSETKTPAKKSASSKKKD